MKKFYFWYLLTLIIVALLPQAADAQQNRTQQETSSHVTAQQAMDIGYAFMHTGKGSKGNGTKSGAVRKQAMQLVYTGRATDSLTRAVTDCYYVFALQPKGFVIVAADDRVEPILGYSYDNDFVVENMPAHVRSWLGAYEKQIEAVAKSDQEADPAAKDKWMALKMGQPMNSAKNGTTVGPLLTTTWNQGQYYNNLCPADAYGPAGHVYTGCVATAMAQIIHYWGYPTQGRGIHSYSSNYGTLEVNYNSASYDHTLMPNALTSTSSTQEVNAVATLMRDCGVAVNMGYSPTESSSFDQDARAAFINFYRFSPDLSFAEKAYFSDSDWDAMLHDDLDNGRPIFYSGQGSGGHAFVCDGYDADGYYHFNFGWGGFADGWFLTSSVTPGGSNFSSSQSALFGIVPDSTGYVILGQTQGTSTFIVDEPLEFYHLMGHNTYEGGNYYNSCNNTVNFIPANSTNHIVADILDYEDQTLTFSDGNGNQLRSLVGGNDNDYSPVVSSYNSLNISYSGNMYYAGFKLNISQTDNNGCRMVSNITSFVEAQTVHLTWTENGMASQWEIEYGVKGFALGTGTTYTATANTATFNNLSKFTEYDFYIRPVCGVGQYGLRNKISVMVEAEYWQDIVTSQPAGYVYNAQTNSVEISSAEGLAWWAKNPSSKVYLTTDIDLSEYKWRPVNLNQKVNIIFDGKGYQITHAYMRENAGDVGLFNRTLIGGFVIIENLGLTNSYVKGTSGKTGGIGGLFMGNCIIRNCYVSNSTIDGDDETGGLFGEVEGSVINCYVNANVIGKRWVGLMIGVNMSSIRNCYAAGTVRHRSSCYIAGITSYCLGDEISNCYSVETEMGVVGYKGGSIITDTSTFVQSNTGWTLITPVIIDDVTETDLLSALNKGVKLYNDSVYCAWVADTGNVNGGYPVFGNKHVVQCPNLTDVSVQNVMVNNNYAVTVSWAENNNATQWLIRYRRHDMPDSVYTYVTATSNPDTIFGIPLGYSYDFNVRTICDTNNRSGWSETQTLIVDLPYWTDIVTTQPTGFVENPDGNVEIYSTEGLAWLAVITNGFHNQQQSSFEGKTVTLKSDINLEGYRWYPIGGFSGTFDGLNHQISNIYINGASGLFGYVYLGRVRNVNLIGGSVIGGSGGLIGTVRDGYEISNCHSSATIYGNGGALCGGISNYGTSKIIVSNCSSSGTVNGREGCGNLIGTVAAYSGDVEIRNSYAIGNVNSVVYRDEYAWYRGGLIGYVRGGHVDNCFSTGSVEIDNYYPRFYGKVIGALDLNPHVHYLYGQDNVNEGWGLTGNFCEDYSNSSAFHHNGNTNALLDSVTIGGTAYFDLLDALNAWVISQNDSTLRLWILDSISGYPVFGDYYVPSCFNPTNLTVSQATVVGDSTIKTRLSWTQNGEPDHWEVLYVATGQSITSGNVGTIVPVNSNPCVLAGIIVGQPLDFYVRAVCGDGDASGWCGPVTYLPDKLHWTEVVTSQPEGFQLDANHNVYISSAEGLSWLSSIVNGLNNAHGQSINNVVLTKDIDLSAYRWTAIHGCDASFNGNNHVVTGLYCNELSDYQGLFGNMNGNVCNLILTQCNVNGSQYVGTIAGCSGSRIVNCLVNGIVSGYGNVGGLAGRTNIIENSCFIGNVASGRYFTTSAVSSGYSGGITGSSFNNTIVNCYVAGDFTDIENYCSAIIAYSGFTSMVSNCYYKVTETNLPITNGDQSNNSDFIGSNYAWTLNTPPYINGAFHSDLVDALNAWVDENNTNGQYNRWAADTDMVNGGYPVFEFISLPAVIVQDTVVVQGYYSWHGMVFTSNTTITDTIPTLNGYDSVVTHHIIVTPALLTEVAVDTCSIYTWNEETYDETGDYVQTFSSVNGSDSVVVLRLTINPQSGVYEHFVCGNSYTWIDGVTYIVSNNTATYWLQTTDGCDSVVTLHLTINHPVSELVEATANDGYIWDGDTLTEFGDYVRIYTASNGCDSVVTLHLTVKPVVTTGTVSDISARTATCSGNVISDGGAEVTERGICWATTPNPTIDDNHTTESSGSGPFTSSISGLIPNTTYHVQAYATNSVGTAYGEEVTFTTTTTETYSCGDNLIFGGYIYTTNQYGSQCWMTQNLRNVNGSYQFDYPDIMQACPTGWHLPDNSEWDILGNNLPSSLTDFGDGDYWTSTLMIWQGNEGDQLTLISPPYVQSNNVTYTGIACEIHDAAQVNCVIHTPLSVRCLRDENASATLPTVITDTIINITANSATCVCNVTNDGGTEVTERGICWHTSQDSTVTISSAGTGMFTVTLSDLTPNTTYHVRAYATNGAGTVYSEEVTFTTALCNAINFTLSGNPNICESEPVSLTANIEATGFTPDNLHYTWYKDGQVLDNMAYGLDNSNEFVDYLFSRTEPYHFMVEVTYGTDASCVFHSEEYFVYVHPQPGVFIFPSETNICEGSTATLTAWVDSILNPNYDYQWFRSIPGSTTEFVGNGATYTTTGSEPASNYTYWVQVTSEYGCSSQSDPVMLTINQPTTGIDVQTVCGSYTWIDGITYTESNNTATYTLTNAVGCDSVVTLHLTVNDTPPTPVVTVDNANIFEGAQLTVSVTNPIDGAVYTWYRNGVILEGATQAVFVDHPTAIDGETAYYTYSVFADLPTSGCVSNISSSTMVMVNPLPVVTVTVEGNTVLCEGSSVTLHADVAPYNDPTYVYQWYEDGVPIPGATSADYVVLEPARTNTYNFMVMVSDMSGSFNITANAPAITVVPSPTVVASISDSTICVGGTATLTATVEGGVAGINGYNFQWYEIAGTSTPWPEVVGTGSSYTTSGDEPAGNYPYWVMVSDEYGCSSQSGMVILSVVSQPAVTITRTVGYGEMVCEGGSTAIQANVTGGYGELSYQWYANGFILAEETNQSLAINNLSYSMNDTYTVVVAQTGAGCSNSASADINTLVSVYPSYTVAVSGPNEICEGGDLTMYAEANNVIPGDVLSYQWHEIMSGQDILIEGANSIMYTAVDLQSGSLYEYYVVVNSNLSGCTATSSVHVVNVNALSHINLYETSCEYYTWNDMTYSASGEYTQTFTNAAGCDSVVTLHLTINHSTSSDTTAMACNSFDWYEQTNLTQSGDYTRTLTNASGCDSVITLHLTINQPSTGTDVQTACGSYTWIDGITYTESNNTATYTLTNAAGCDSVVTLNLTINQPTTGIDVQTACGSFTWIDGITYTESNSTATYTLSNAVGCDSIVILHLTINTATIGDTTAVVCGSFDWYGMHLTQSGEYTHTLTNVAGCDSVVTLHLTVNQPTAGVDVQTACGSFTWIDGVTYTESNSTATYTLTNAVGCDSVVTLNLTINHPVTSTSTATICDNELPYIWNGVTFNEAGTQNLTLQAMNGCDSTVEMNLTVTPSVTIDAYLTISDNDLPFTYGDTTFMPGTVQSGDYTFNFTTADGCDSIIILHLTVETGISSYDLNARMKVYPNPTKDVVNVELSMKNVQSNNVVIQVYDMYGKLLDVVETRCTTSLQHTASPYASNMANAHGATAQTTQIDLSRYANGVYFIKAVSEGKVLAVRKVVKN